MKITITEPNGSITTMTPEVPQDATTATADDEATVLHAFIAWLLDCDLAQPIFDAWCVEVLAAVEAR